MIIQFASGKTMEGIALSIQNHTMRVALRGHNDAIELFQVNGCWITEGWEAVRIHSGVEASEDRESASEAEFVCSRELASQLITLLQAGSAADLPAASWPVEPWSAAPPSFA